MEGDALNIIEPLRNKKQNSYTGELKFKAVLEDVLFLAKSFDNVSFSFICKERNLTVHLIARWADLLNWIGVPIFNLSLLLAQALDRDGHKPPLDCISFVSSYK